MLSDWGSSVDGNKGMTLKSFCGCTPNAHDRLLGKQSSFRLGEDLDFASLAYTIDHVETGKLQRLYKFNRPSQVTTANLKNGMHLRANGFSRRQHPCKSSTNDIREALAHACCSQRSDRLRQV
jgi:hypothetical protein